MLVRIVEHLQAAGKPHALFGAAAMAVHGVSRATVDVDLLITADALDRVLWSDLRGLRVDVRMGDEYDNLLGRVKAGPSADVPVDLVAPRGRWPRRALERATRRVRVDGVEIPVLEVPDLVLAKVHAGGQGDTRDILLILEAFPERHAEIIAHVDAEVAYLYGPARRHWLRLRSTLR